MPAYTHADAEADIASIKHALATEDAAVVAAAAARVRTLLNASGVTGSVISAHRAELGRLLQRCEGDLSGYSTAS